MNEQLRQIREQQRASWNTFSPGWKKWDTKMMEFLHPIGDEIIRTLAPNGTQRVLDVAAGTGEPGLTIAELLPSGHVVITDLAEDMLEIARQHADHRGVKNITILPSDVCELPFEDNSFDAISCRFGFMFFPDMQLAANEMARVLKPGGRVATSVWNIPENNFWVTAIMGTINRNMELPPPPPGAPGMFRCAQDGLIAEHLSNAGLVNVRQEEVATRLNIGTADRYWELMTEVGAPIVAALSKADEPMRAKIKEQVFTLVHERFAPDAVVFDASALLISGEKH